MTILNGNFNPSINEYGVYVANLGAYNSGILHGSWLALPASEEEIEETMKQVFSGQFSWDFDREYAIHDFSAPFRIEEYEGLEQLNDQIDRLTKALYYSGFDTKIVHHLKEIFSDVEEIIEALEDDRVRVYHDCKTVGDVMQEMYENGDLFSDVPYQVMSYFNWDRYGRDVELSTNGSFIERVIDLHPTKYSVIEVMYK